MNKNLLSFEEFFNKYTYSQQLSEFNIHHDFNLEKQLLNFFNISDTNLFIFLPFLAPTIKNCYYIKEKDYTLFAELFNVNINKFNQLLTIYNFIDDINTGFNRIYSKNKIITIIEKTSELIEFSLHGEGCIFKFSDNSITFKSRKFELGEEQIFPIDEMISFAYYDLNDFLQFISLDPFKLNSKDILSIYNMSLSDYMQSKNVIESFKYKTFEEICEVFEEASDVHGKNYDGMVTVDNYEHFDDIKKSFVGILDSKNYSYFCQSIDLIKIYYKFIKKRTDLISEFYVFRPDKDKLPENCYHFIFEREIELIIGKNFYDINSASLISYKLIKDLDSNNTNSMADFYTFVLNLFSNKISKILSREVSKIKVGDLKLLEILLH